MHASKLWSIYVYARIFQFFRSDAPNKMPALPQQGYATATATANDDAPNDEATSDAVAVNPHLSLAGHCCYDCS